MSPTPNFLVSNLIFLMDRRGLNPNSLSDSMSNEPPQATIFRILNGQSKTPRDTTVQALADFFGVSIQALRYSDLSKATTFVEPLFGRQHASSLKARKVVVLTTQDGLPEKIWNDGEDQPMRDPEGFAIIASDDERAFLVPVLDDAMSPRFNIGEYALVEPGVEAELEDDVLVRLATGQVLLRRLLSRRSGLKFGFYKSGETQVFAQSDVSWIYYVSNPVPARKVNKS